jgi:rod shape-determining protein MreC
MAQLVLLAVSAKNDQDVRFIRLWTVTAVTPVARIIEGFRGGSTGFLHNYILLHDANQENQRLRAELDRMKMENIFLKNELNTADRAKALQVFQAHTPSKTVAATIIATGAGSNSKVVFVDRGTASGVQRGMAVVTPDGIVGKVIAAYPTASQILLITDPDFAAGVIFEKSQVHGTLKGQGTPQCKVDYVAFEEKVEPGEWVYTSGDDRTFPRGFRVGIVRTVRPGQPFKEILVEPSAIQRGLVDDVLILIEGVHQRIPDAPSGMQPIYIAPAPPGSESTKPADAAPAPATGTEADRLRSQYQTLGQEQKHTYGENPPGTKPPDFTRLPTPGAPAGAAGQAPATAPASPAKSTASPAAVPLNPVTPGQAPSPARSTVPSTASPTNPEVRKNPASLPGTSPGTPSTPAPKTGPAVQPSGPAGNPSAPGAPPSKNPPDATRPAPPRSTGPYTITPLNPDVRKNPVSPPGAPPVNTPAAPAKSGPADQPSGPAKNPTTPGAPPAKNPPDAARRVNPAAGVPPGGQPH